VFESVSRSIDIAKISLDVLMKDKELLLFPLLAGVFSIILFIIMILPIIVSALVEKLFGPVGGILQLVLICVFYFGAAFIATFFNVCCVYN
jgi:hypothetical protein